MDNQQLLDQADKLIKRWESWQTRNAEWRKVIDREAAADLAAFAEILPEPLKNKWVSVQSGEAQQELQRLAALLTSNQPELEAIAMKDTTEAREDAQALEQALEGLLEYMTPASYRMARYFQMMESGFAAEAVDISGAGPEKRKYGKRKELQEYAEKDDSAEDQTPGGRYKRAYRENEKDHEKAYAAVMEDADAKDGIPVCRRLIEIPTFAFETDEYGSVQMGVEHANISITSAVDIAAPFNVVNVDGRLQVGAQSFLSEDRQAVNAFTVEGSCSYGDTVEYKQVRTRDKHVISIKGAKSGEADASELIISYPNPFPEGIGYYVTAALDKKRGSPLHRYEPWILALLVEVQMLNIAQNGMYAMAWQEASRDEYQNATADELAAFPPGDPTQEQKGSTGTDDPPAIIAGKLLRVESTGLDMVKLVELARQNIAGYRSSDLFAGSGSSEESGRHLARVQTAQFTMLAPLQTKVSETDKRILLDVKAWVARSGRSIKVSREPVVEKRNRTGIQVAVSSTLTPQLAKTEAILRVTTGADTPEARYAAMAVSRAEMAVGAHGITEHRELTGKKNPQQSEERLIEDRLAGAAIAIGEQKLVPMVDAAMEAIVNFVLPKPQAGIPPPAEEQQPPLPPMEPEGGPGRGSMTEFVDQPVPMMDGVEVPDVAGTPGQVV